MYTYFFTGEVIIAFYKEINFRFIVEDLMVYSRINNMTMST